MGNAFLAIAATPAVKAVQAVQGSRHAYARLEGGPATQDRLGPAEAAFIAARDSFYMATVSEAGWPYIQHRGGRPGFLHVLDERTRGLADLRGNRQYISLGNLAGNDRAALILMDYPNRRRLKLLVRVTMREAVDDPALVERLAVHCTAVIAERALLLHIEAFDWNCPQHIMPRFTTAEVEPAFASLRDRLAALEAENAALTDRLDPKGDTPTYRTPTLSDKVPIPMPTAALGGERRSELVPPVPHHLVADLDAALVQMVLHVPQRQREADVERNGHANDLG